jgi:hypothetical protein
MKKTILFALLSSTIFSINAMAENADRVVDKALLNQEPTKEVITSTTGQKIELTRSIDSNGIVTTTTTNVSPATHDVKEVKPVEANNLTINGDVTTFEAHPIQYVVDGKTYNSPSFSSSKDLIEVKLAWTRHHKENGFFSFFHPKLTETTQELNAHVYNGFAAMGGETNQTSYIQSASVDKDTQKISMQPGVVQSGFQYFFLPTLTEDKHSVNLRYKLNWANLNSISTVNASNGLSVQTPNTQEDIAQGLVNIKLDTPTTLIQQGEYDMVVTVHTLK